MSTKRLINPREETADVDLQNQRLVDDMLLLEKAEECQKAGKKVRFSDTQKRSITRALQSSCYIYFIKAEYALGLIKIGKARDVSRRLSQLQGASPVPLRPIAVFRGYDSLEVDLHHHFEQHRSHNEWFFPTQAVFDMIESVKIAGLKGVLQVLKGQTI